MIRKFNRYELKFLLRHREYEGMRDQILKRMLRDPHASDRGRYYISSLYFDSSDLACFRSKLDGIKYRRKLRIRTYDRSDLSRVFVEIKQRVDRTVQKRRMWLDFAEAEKLCRGSEISLEGMDETDRNTASEVRYMVKALSLMPKCIISYQREPFEGGRFEPGVRVTFDHLLAYRTHNLDLNLLTKNRPVLAQDSVFLEIKVNERIPNWLRLLLSRSEPRGIRVSKYCQGMKAGLNALDRKRTMVSR